MKIQGKILFRISTITILFCFIISSNKAQYTSANVTTPKGSTVTAYTATEQSTFWRNYWDNAYAASGRSFVDYFSDGYSSSQRYNDIGYAWQLELLDIRVITNQMEMFTVPMEVILRFVVKLIQEKFGLSQVQALRIME